MSSIYLNSVMRDDVLKFMAGNILETSYVSTIMSKYLISLNKQSELFAGTIL